MTIVARVASRAGGALQAEAIWAEVEGDPALAANAALVDRHRGRRAFVIGNGPSLATQDLGALRDEITFVMNAFWKHSAMAEWQPSYYCLVDPLYFDGSEGMRAFLGDLQRRLHTTELIVPLVAAASLQRQHLLDGVQKHFVYPAGQWELDRPIDLTRVVPVMQSVSQLAIAAAIYMGCSPIYLLGLDHDWLAHRGPDRHFYEGKTIDSHPKAHGDLSRVPYKADLEACLRLWRGYETLDAHAQSRGSRILNATRGGFLDVYPRVSFESVIGG